MSCQSCIYSGIEYIFSGDVHKPFFDAASDCQKQPGGRLALVSSAAIRNQLITCCRTSNPYWVTLPGQTSSTCTCFTTTSPYTEAKKDCNSALRYICQRPASVTSTNTQNGVTNVEVTASNLPQGLGTTAGANENSVNGLVYALIGVGAVLVLLVVLFYAYARRRKEKNGVKPSARPLEIENRIDQCMDNATVHQTTDTANYEHDYCYIATQRRSTGGTTSSFQVYEDAETEPSPYMTTVSSRPVRPAAPLPKAAMTKAVSSSPVNLHPFEADWMVPDVIYPDDGPPSLTYVELQHTDTDDHVTAPDSV